MFWSLYTLTGAVRAHQPLLNPVGSPGLMFSEFAKPSFDYWKLSLAAEL